MKVLVTGGAGFIGSNFIHHVLVVRKDWHVVNFDKLTYAGNLANLSSVAASPHYTFIRGDICDGPAVAAAMQGCDTVVHFATRLLARSKESKVPASVHHPSRIS